MSPLLQIVEALIPNSEVDIPLQKYPLLRDLGGQG